jgi:DNA polymerase III delta subunit
MSEYYWGEDTYAAWQAIVEAAKKAQAEIRWLEASSLKEKGLNYWADRGNGFWKHEIIVIKDPLKTSSDVQADLVEAVKEGKAKAVIFWEKGKPDQRLKLHKELLKDQVYAYQALAAEKLEEWAIELAKKEGVTMKNEPARWLVAALEGDRWRIENEIKRLALLEQDISMEVVKQDNDLEVKAEIFKVLEAVARGDSKYAVRGIETILNQGEPELRLMAMLNHQFKSLWLIAVGKRKNKTQNQVVSETKLHPYVVEKNWNLATSSKGEAGWWVALRRIAASNLAIKQGKMKERTALLMAVVSLADLFRPSN